MILPFFCIRRQKSDRRKGKDDSDTGVGESVGCYKGTVERAGGFTAIFFAKRGRNNLC